MIKMKLSKYINKYRNIFIDIFLNTMAFGLYTLAQQVILLPILAKKVDVEIFASIIILIMVINIISNVFGGQLGVVRQIKDKDYGNKKDLNDFYILMIVSSILIFFILFFVSNILKYEIQLFIIIALLIIVTNFRFYLRAIFRLENTYTKLIIQNTVYLVGIIVGLVLMNVINMPILPLIIGEVFALVYSIFNITIVKPCFQKSDKFSSTFKDYIGLSIASVFTNSVSFVDRILTYPLLGPSSLAVYNAGSTVAKISAFIINPLNDVVLVQLSKSRSQEINNIINIIIKGSLIIILILSILTIPVIYLLSLILYPQFVSKITSIIIYLSVSFSVGIATHIMKSFILTYTKSYKLSIVYAVNLISMAILGWIGAKFYGLEGFAAAILIVRIQTWVLFVYLLKSRKKEVMKKL